MILVQHEFTVPREQHAEFERLGHEAAWPLLQHTGAQMVAFGAWGFGGSTSALVEHTIYEDFEHWEASRRPSGALASEAQSLLDAAAERESLALDSFAQPFDLFEASTRSRPFRRSAGQDLAAVPPSFGAGSVISERTIELEDGSVEEFNRLSLQLVWPWLESQGGRGIAIGHNLMATSSEVTTWFAFPSLAQWYKFARPQTAHAPAEVAEAFRARQELIRGQSGRLLTIGSDFGFEG